MGNEGLRMRSGRRTVAGGWATAAALVAACLAGPGPAPALAVDLVKYDSKYYTIYTDVDPEVEREAAARMTHMADEYHARTQSFAGRINHKFPFYLYKVPADYYAAGGMKGSAGVFAGSSDGTGKLMAIAGERITPYTWHTVQHEGFHQFAASTIGFGLPVWLNEGLAEYFGEGLYTGDGFITGVVPPARLGRVQGEIRGDQMKGVKALMAVSGQQWAAEMNIRNYDQAWSMVHFLVHGDGGKYAPAFSQCIREIANGHKSFDTAWADTIGPVDGFEDRWKAYWLEQPRSPTHDLYARATVATLTSFLARATAAKQTFPDLAAFAAAADGNALKVLPDDWLPHSLLAGALTDSHLDHPADDAAAQADDTAQTGSADPKPDRYEYRVGPNHQATLTCVLADGTRLTGWFKLNGTRVGAVNVESDDTAKVLAAAAVLRDENKKAEARAMVQNALRQNPRSALAGDARAFLKTCR